MQWVELPDRKAEISVTAVDGQTYRDYLASTGQPHPDRPVLWQQQQVGVSASEAMAFAAWQTSQESRAYRLPALDELLWLAQQSGRMRVWPCHPGQTFPGTMPTCPYEWLQCRPCFSGEHARWHCATHPGWLMAAPKPVIRAAFADARFPYITFRLVRERP